MQTDQAAALMVVRKTVVLSQLNNTNWGMALSVLLTRATCRINKINGTSAIFNRLH